MKAAGKTALQASIAEQCGWSGPSAVSQYLNGRIPLNLMSLTSICKAIEADPFVISPRLMETLPSIRPSAELTVDGTVKSEILKSLKRLDYTIRGLKTATASDEALAIEALEHAMALHLGALSKIGVTSA